MTARQPCTCAHAETPPPLRHGQRLNRPDTCPACRAWEHGTVLLLDGTQVSKPLWLLTQEPLLEKADP
jgi:hypothetical protein